MLLLRAHEGNAGAIWSIDGSHPDYLEPKPCVRNNVVYDLITRNVPGLSRRPAPGTGRDARTLGGDGFPQLTEVWFLHDEGELKISLNTSRLKTRNLQARSECSLLILDLANPYRYLEVRGRARIEPDDDYAFAKQVGAKYGADLSEHDGPGDRRVVVTIEPVNVYAVDMSGG